MRLSGRQTAKKIIGRDPVGVSVNISHADTGGHPKAVQRAAALTTQARGKRHCAPYHPLLRGECYTLISRIVAVVFVTGGRTITRPLFSAKSHASSFGGKRVADLVVVGKRCILFWESPG